MRAYILIFSVILLNIPAFSQQSLSYAYVDSLTYSLYLSKEYKSLQKHGTKALKNNIDFYYLRMRLGISYYEQNNYERALKHFRAAREMNPADTIMREYLYFSLLYTLRKEEAKELADNFPESMKVRIQEMIGHLSGLTGSAPTISVSGGLVYNTNIADNEKKDLLGTDGIFAINTLQGNTSVMSLFAEGKKDKRLRFVHAASVSNVKSLGIVQSVIDETKKREYDNRNLKYALGVNYLLKNDYRVGISAAYYKENSNVLIFKLLSYGPDIKYEDWTHDHNAFTFSLNLSGCYGNLRPDISFFLGSLADKKQSGAGAGLLYFFFGNTRLYSYSRVVFVVKECV